MSQPQPQRQRPLNVLANRSVGAKIFTIVGIASLAGVILVGLAIFNLKQASDRAHQLSDVSVVATNRLAIVHEQELHARLRMAEHVIAAPEQRPELEADMAADEADIQKAWAEYKAVTETTAESRAAIKAFEEGWAEYVDVRDNVLIPASNAGTAAAAKRGTAAYLRMTQEILPPAASALDALEAYEVEVAQTTADESTAAINRAIVTLIVALLVAAVFTIWLATRIVRMITVPLRSVSEAATGLSQFDLSRTSHAPHADEVGQMAEAFESARMMFRTAVSDGAEKADDVARAAADLLAVAEQVSAASEETAAQSQAVSAAAEQVSVNVQTVAAAAEEMGASIAGIAHNAQEAARVGAIAAEQTAGVRTAIDKLESASTQIGSAVESINAIAEQTKLLALNAAIEAARAGAAGKGFAVVATEVKDLAGETAGATTDIATRIQTIQAEVSNVSAIIGQIVGSINEVTVHQSDIASAVEQQTATTQEMTMNIAQAAAGSAEIAENVVTVATAAEQSSQAASQTRTSAQHLTSVASVMQEGYARFTL
ncbi:methyl-accepting chemotaxis protein [Nocardioides sp. GY 10113]|uniref:methyl-accepting chemotaxis protein n=1 Tax=Nocardioides sp. GY 10113 TaxID=2569761 RepID=UPI0014585D9F|nr:methyl-accepting chemotaxis protein [Nocardioides sp. GY 10113]